MGSKELIESLWKAADEKIQAIRHEAEAKAEKIKEEAARRGEQLRQDHARSESAASGEYRRTQLAAANTRARDLRLAAEQALSERLREAARSTLHDLRDGNYSDIFAVMAREVPSLPWQSVRVNPGDVDLAKQHFPDAEIIPDDQISGGMDATAEDGTIRVVNTFERRLERIWMDLLPALMRDVYEQCQPLSESEDREESKKP